MTTMVERYETCSGCKPSEWTICPRCGKHYCDHNQGHGCAPMRIENQLKRVVPTYAGEYSVRVEDNQGSFNTQSSPGYYRRKDREEWIEAMANAGLSGHVQAAGKWSTGRDWHGRTYGSDGTYWIAWIETTMETERADRQRFKDALDAERMAAYEDALAMDRESYERKETICRLTGML